MPHACRSVLSCCNFLPPSFVVKLVVLIIVLHDQCNQDRHDSTKRADSIPDHELCQLVQFDWLDYFIVVKNTN